MYGITTAILTLLRSSDPGKYAAYSQFETIRKIRAAYTNAYMASLTGSLATVSLGSQNAKTFLTNAPTKSLWFERFCSGCLKRMGQNVKQDLAISIDVLLELLDAIRERARSTKGWTQQLAIMAGAYSCIAFCGSFCGHEVYLVDLDGLFKYNDESKRGKQKDHVVIPLLGRFRGGTGERYHLTPLAASTQSGIELKFWIKLLLGMHSKNKRVRGPAFVDKGGNTMKSKTMQKIILSILEKIKFRRPDLIPESVDAFEDYDDVWKSTCEFVSIVFYF